jgi:hypothetical protein
MGKGPAPNTYRGSHRCGDSTCSGCEGIAIATWKLYRTLCRPTQKDGIAPFGASQLVPGSGEGQNTLKLQEFDSCMKGAGRSSNPSVWDARAFGQRPVRVQKRTELFCTVVVQARPMRLQLDIVAASVPSSPTPSP